MSDVTLMATNIRRQFVNSAGETLTILKDVNLTVRQGELVAIIGASGTGKSTLLHILGGLDDADSGVVQIAGHRLDAFSGQQRDALRNQYLGFVFQFHHLLPEFTAQENVAMPLWIRGVSRQQSLQLAMSWLEKVGLASRFDHLPAHLSGGERQRVAIARSMVTEPACILADEPTGNLDFENSQKIIDLMFLQTRQHQCSLVMVTHDMEIAKRCDVVYRLVAGQLMRVS